MANLQIDLSSMEKISFNGNEDIEKLILNNELIWEKKSFREVWSGSKQYYTDSDVYDSSNFGEASIPDNTNVRVTGYAWVGSNRIVFNDMVIKVGETAAITIEFNNTIIDQLIERTDINLIFKYKGYEELIGGIEIIKVEAYY